MKLLFNRFTTLFLMLSALLLSIPASAETVEIKGYLYDLNKEDHVATLMRYNGTSTTVVIPTTIKFADVEYHVTAIHNRAFRDSKMQKYIKKLTIGDSIKVIDNNTFENCSELSSVTFGKSITTIGYSVFCGCTKLSSIVMPNTVTSIGGYAFADCLSLKTIVIGINVASIGEKAFSYCNKLKTITCLAKEVPTTDTSAFKFIKKSEITLIVDKSAIDNYKKAEPWNNFILIKFK